MPQLQTKLSERIPVMMTCSHRRGSVSVDARPTSTSRNDPPSQLRCDGDRGFGSKRALALYARHKPELIILIPWCIFFIEGGGSERPISSQTYTHCWLVWPERGKRNSNKETRVEWASQHVEVQSWH